MCAAGSPRKISRCASRWTAASRPTPSPRPPRPAPTRSWPAPRCTARTTPPRRFDTFVHWPRRLVPSHDGAGLSWGECMSADVLRDIDDLGPEPEQRPDLILVVDDDQDIAGFVEFNLKVH